MTEEGKVGKRKSTVVDTKKEARMKRAQSKEEWAQQEN